LFGVQHHTLASLEKKLLSRSAGEEEPTDEGLAVSVLMRSLEVMCIPCRVIRNSASINTY